MKYWHQKKEISKKMDDRRSAPKNGPPKVVPQKLDDRRSAPKNSTTEGRPLKIRRPKVGP